ncbi:MAG: oxidoreductase [Magnetospirillum sp.]|nr:MAG: oxidoreductase [Magnetospirillum sp.]
MYSRVAVIGCGHWGRNIVRNIHKLGVLAAVCDVDEDIAMQAAAATGAPCCNLDEILDDAAIGAVMVAAPAEHHHPIAMKALAAGKHVFVEKPLAMSLDEGRELIELAEAKGLILMVGHLLQYHPAFVRLKEVAASGRLGHVHYIYSNRLSFGRIRKTENALWSFAPHDVSMILTLAGRTMPQSVSAIGHTYLSGGIPDVTTTHMTFADGMAAHVHVSWLHPFREQRLVVIGDQGMAVFNDRNDWDEKLLIYPHQVEWRDGVPEPVSCESQAEQIVANEPLEQECRHFLDCIARGARPLTDGYEGLEVLGVLHAAEQSMRLGAVVPVVVMPPSKPYFVHPTSIIDSPCEIGAGTRIWHYSHILGGTSVGHNVIIGQNVMIGPDVQVGDRCKIQNNVSLYKGVTLEDDVFCGPSVTFTNVIRPRAHIDRRNEFKSTIVRKGATIGANATIVCGTVIGRHALIGAGAVVTHDVPDHALMIGNPARRVGAVCICGESLPSEEWTVAQCSACGQWHHKVGDVISASMGPT